MNILSLFPLIPLVMMLGLWISKNTRQIHAVMVAGSSALLALAIYLVFHYLGLREAGATDAMLLRTASSGTLHSTSITQWAWTVSR